MCASRILPFALHDALCHGRLGDEKRVGDLGRRQTAEKAKRQRDLRLPTSAGWQQVKIRRRRSSCTGPSSGGGDCAWIRAACACRSCRVASRRSRSIARLRAVVMIQPAGLGGIPGTGPALHRDLERILYRVFGDVDVAEDAAEDGDRPSVLGAEHRGDRAVSRSSVSATRWALHSLWMGRTSIGTVIASAIRRPQSRAASRSGASMIEKPPSTSLLST